MNHPSRAARNTPEATITQQNVQGLADQELQAVGHDAKDTRILRIRERDILSAVMQQQEQAP